MKKNRLSNYLAIVSKIKNENLTKKHLDMWIMQISFQTIPILGLSLKLHHSIDTLSCVSSVLLDHSNKVSFPQRKKQIENLYFSPIISYSLKEPKQNIWQS